MKKMIITGVNGFIGRCAMEYFSKDYEITGIDLADRYCEDGAEIHYYQCNMSKDSQELANIFTGVQPDVILHCAGSANVGASIVNPMADLDGNLHSLYQLLLALKSFEKRPKIIFLSSAVSMAIQSSFRSRKKMHWHRSHHMACTSRWARNSAAIITGYMVTISAVCVSFLHMEADCANSFCGIFIRNT